MTSLSQFLSISKLLKNGLILGIVSSPTTILCSDTTKTRIIFGEKKTINDLKITKQSHAYKSYASTLNVDLLNSFNPELLLKDNKPAIKDFLPELREFEFEMTKKLKKKKKKEYR